MSIYKDRQAMTDVAVHLAKEHNCNYNIIVLNPDETGEFSEAIGSTYEMVTDSYFEKERPNAILLEKTCDIIGTDKEFVTMTERKKSRLDDFDHLHDMLPDPEVFEISDIYAGFRDAHLIDRGHFGSRIHPGVTYIREECKIGNNDICPKCDSGKKYKKCCK